MTPIARPAFCPPFIPFEPPLDFADCGGGETDGNDGGECGMSPLLDLDGLGKDGGVGLGLSLGANFGVYAGASVGALVGV